MKKNLVILLLLVSVIVNAQTSSELSLSLPDVMTGKLVSFKEFSTSPGVVIIFTSVACPFDGYYTSRLKQLQSAYADKLPILLVNSCTEAPEGDEWMKKTAEANGLTLPYLSDKEQLLMSQLGAQRSPEVFVLKSVNGLLKEFYHGAIDDNAQAETAVKQTHLKNAIDALLSEKPISTSTTRTVGCYIRKK